MDSETVTYGLGNRDSYKIRVSTVVLFLFLSQSESRSESGQPGMPVTVTQKVAPNEPVEALHKEQRSAGYPRSEKA